MWGRGRCSTLRVSLVRSGSSLRDSLPVRRSPRGGLVASRLASGSTLSSGRARRFATRFRFDALPGAGSSLRDSLPVRRSPRGGVVASRLASGSTLSSGRARRFATRFRFDALPGPGLAPAVLRRCLSHPTPPSRTDCRAPDGDRLRPYSAGACCVVRGLAPQPPLGRGEAASESPQRVGPSQTGVSGRGQAPAVLGRCLSPPPRSQLRCYGRISLDPPHAR